MYGMLIFDSGGFLFHRRESETGICFGHSGRKTTAQVSGEEIMLNDVSRIYAGSGGWWLPPLPNSVGQN
jgi:hypothetical protein